MLVIFGRLSFRVFALVGLEFRHVVLRPLLRVSNGDASHHHYRSFYPFPDTFLVFNIL
jgi:hypothetical protein